MRFRRSSMSACPIPFETLLDYHEERLDGAETLRVRAHVDAGCAACDERLALMGRAAAVMRGADAVHAPEHVLQRAREIYRERFRKPARQSFIARLLFDSRSAQPGLAAAGARGAAEASVQTLYSTDAHDVDLFQEAGPEGRWYVIGQVLPREGGAPLAARSVTLLAAEGGVIEASREGSEFHLAEVPAGACDIRVRLDEDEIVLRDVKVGAE
jgi:hypothetical protein